LQIEDDGRTDHAATPVPLTGLAEAEDFWKDFGRQIQVLSINDLKSRGQGLHFFIAKIDRGLTGKPMYWVNDFGDYLIHLDRILPSPDAKYNLALYQLGKGDQKSSRKLLSDLLGTDATNPALLKGMGDYFNALGQKDSAIAYYEKALEAQYEFIDCWMALVKLKPMWYFNLGVLYFDKGKKYERDDLLTKAKGYFEEYMKQIPDGQLVGSAGPSWPRSTTTAGASPPRPSRRP